MVRKRTFQMTLVAVLATLPGCLSDGHLNLFGYSTKPLYRAEGVRTVYVPIFKNVAARDSVRMGIEYTLTRQVIQEIEQKTPYKVVSDRSCADSELIGTIVSITKGIMVVNQNNQVRQGEMYMNVSILWTDLRTGEVLSGPPRKIGDLPLPTPSLPPPTALPITGAPVATAPVTDGVPVLSSPVEDVPLDEKPKGKPVIISSSSSFTPELGQSTMSALQGNVERLATQIVSMMEAPW
jgi:hypothetical protein